MVLEPSVGGLFAAIRIFTMFTMTKCPQLGDYSSEWVL